MPPTTLHDPDRYMADLRQILSQGRKRIGILIGAGAPSAIRVYADSPVASDDRPLIPDVEDLTNAVIDALSKEDRAHINVLKNEIQGNCNIEAILTRIRKLAQAIGTSVVHGLDGQGYEKLALDICAEIGKHVGSSLPAGTNPYTKLVSWIAGTQREHSVEIFTPNYDLLVEEALERARIAYFDGFSGSSSPFFDPPSVSTDEFPARWARVWKLHGSLGWKMHENTVIRTGQREDTELIFPDHLKYDQITRMPYSALFERLRQFLTMPDTLLVCTGFSFRDSHICAVMEESLAANSHTAVLAFQFARIENEKSAVTIAESRPNLSVYASDGAVIGGVTGHWQPGQSATDDMGNIRQTYWGATASSEQPEFTLGNFASLAEFLALTQAQQMSSPLSAPHADDEEPPEQRER